MHELLVHKFWNSIFFGKKLITQNVRTEHAFFKCCIQNSANNNFSCEKKSKIRVNLSIFSIFWSWDMMGGFFFFCNGPAWTQAHISSSRKDPVRVHIILDSLGCKESENTHNGPRFVSNHARHFLKVGTQTWTRIGSTGPEPGPSGILRVKNCGTWALIYRYVLNY